MKKLEFRSHKGDYCAFTEESVIFANSKLEQARVFPLGSIKHLTTRFGVKLVAVNGEHFYLTFLYMRKKIKNRVKEFAARINGAIASAPKAEPYSTEIDEEKKQSIEQIRIPHLSRKKVIKSLILLAVIVFSLLVLVYLMYVLGQNASSGKGLPNGSEITHIWETLW